MTTMLWGWLDRWLLPAAPTPMGDDASMQETDAVLEDAKRAAREFEQLKRRVRTLGVDVDVTRSWGPRDGQGTEP